MPLEVEVLRHGEPVELRWDYFALSCMYTAAIKEQAPDYEYQPGKTFGELEDGEWIDFSMSPIYYLDIECPLVRRGEQTLLQRHEFVGTGDHKVIFEPGDVLHAWRSGR